MEGLHPGTRRMTIWTLIHVYRTYIDDGQPNANFHDGYLLYGGSGHVRTHVLSLLTPRSHLSEPGPELAKLGISQALVYHIMSLVVCAYINPAVGVCMPLANLSMPAAITIRSTSVNIIMCKNKNG